MAINKENLGDFRDLTAEEQRKIASEGGKASVKARRRKKNLRELVETFGKLKPQAALQELMKQMGVSEEDMSNDMACVVGLYQKAQAGDVSAFNGIRDIRGEKPADKVEQTMDFNNLTIGFVHTDKKLASSEDEVE